MSSFLGLVTVAARQHYLAHRSSSGDGKKQTIRFKRICQRGGWSQRRKIAPSGDTHNISGVCTASGWPIGDVRPRDARVACNHHAHHYFERTRLNSGRYLRSRPPVHGQPIVVRPIAVRPLAAKPIAVKPIAVRLIAVRPLAIKRIAVIACLISSVKLKKNSPPLRTHTRTHMSKRMYYKT